jgi:hypothetical protein
MLASHSGGRSPSHLYASACARGLLGTLLPGFRGCGAASGINYFARDQPLNFRFAAAELRKISTLCCPVTGADRRFRRESARDR